MSRRVELELESGDAGYVPAFVLFGGLAGSALGLLLLLFARLPIALAVLVPSLVAVAVGFTLFVVLHQPRWIQPTRTGFRLFDGHKKVLVRDREVTAFDVAYQDQFKNGELTGIRVSGAITVESDKYRGRLTFSYEYLPIADDPLGELCDRLLRRVSTEVRASLATGGELAGETWRMEGDRLLYTDETGDRTLAVGRMSAVDTFDGTIRIWRVGAADPVVRIPLTERNTSVLLKVLTARIRESGASAPTGKLGRVLYEWDDSNSRAVTVLGYVFAAALCVVACGFSGWMAFSRNRELLAAAVFFLMFNGFAGWLGWRMYTGWQCVIRCHEHGVEQLLNGRRKVLAFADASRFSCAMIRVFVNGVYGATTYKYQLRGRGGREIHHETKCSHGETLDCIRDHIARALAARGLDSLSRGEKVRWGDSMWLTPGGLEIGTRARKVPYSEVGEVRTREGKYHVFSTTSEFPLQVGSLDERDYFTGLFILGVLREVLVAPPRRDESPVPMSEPLYVEPTRPTPTPDETPVAEREPSGPARTRPTPTDDYRRKPKR